MPRMKRPTYKAAIEWIAEEDSPGDNDPHETLRGYLTVCLVADMFDVDQDKVARDVIAWRANMPRSNAIRHR